VHGEDTVRHGEDLDAVEVARKALQTTSMCSSEEQFTMRSSSR
jgi:hypothetical protein